MNKKYYNSVMERLNKIGTSKDRRKKFKHIFEELGERRITLKDIAEQDFGGKSRGFIDMVNKTGMTMDEVVGLQAYSKAIIDRDVKAMEFIRDSKGEKPSTTVDMTVGEKSAIEQMSDEEIAALYEVLKVSVELAQNDGK